MVRMPFVFVCMCEVCQSILFGYNNPGCFTNVCGNVGPEGLMLSCLEPGIMLNN